MPRRRFTEEEAEAIRYAYNPDLPERGYKGLAHIWNCSPDTIKNIVQGRTYTPGAAARQSKWLKRNSGGTTAGLQSQTWLNELRKRLPELRRKGKIRSTKSSSIRLPHHHI